MIGFTEKEQDFMRQVDKNPNAVVVVTAYAPDGKTTTGVFSTYEKAEAWADELGDHSTIYVPMIIDFPEWGNVKGC